MEAGTFTINRHIQTLAVKDLSERRSAVREVLSSEGIKFQTMEEKPSAEYPNGVLNYTFASHRDSGNEGGLSRYLFAAHYDNFPGSFGANDNAAAVCILIDLCKALDKNDIHADFVLLDGEESGFSGSRTYTASLQKDSISFDGVINLDVCGYGDSIVIFGKGHEKKKQFRRFMNRELLNRHNASPVNYLPESDDVIFRKQRFSTLSVSILPKWDVQYLKALASFGDRVLGMPPEFKMIADDMEIAQTMHGGFKDKIEYVKESSMRQVYEYLFEAMISKQDNNSSSGLFNFFSLNFGLKDLKKGLIK